MACCPDVLLLDEPFSLKTTDSLTEFLIDSQVKDKMAVVVATHNLEWVLQHSDYVATLDKGQLVSFKKTDSLFPLSSAWSEIVLYWK